MAWMVSGWSLAGVIVWRNALCIHDSDRWFSFVLHWCPSAVLLHLKATRIDGDESLDVWSALWPYAIGVFAHGFAQFVLMAAFMSADNKHNAYRWLVNRFFERDGSAAKFFLVEHRAIGYALYTCMMAVYGVVVGTLAASLHRSATVHLAVLVVVAVIAVRNEVLLHRRDIRKP
jgi:hypothetical protein